MMRATSSVLAVLAIAMLAVTPAGAAKRVALVIGNSAYEHVTQLANPRNDATDVAERLNGLGFDVRLAHDLSAADMRAVIADFSDVAVDADIALVFFAGHGLELDRINYLVPVDAKLEFDRRVRFEAVSLDDVEAALEAVQGIRIVLLDACRNNPFAASMKMSSASRSIGRGLSRVEAVTGSLVSFAAKEGTVAADGDGRNSPFTAALLDNLGEPGVEIGLLFRKVRDSVLTATNGRQEPYVSTSLPSDPIYLVPPAAAAAPQPAPVPPNVAPSESPPAGSRPSAEARIARDYELAAEIGTKEAWEAFLARHGSADSFYVDLAKAALKKFAVGVFPTPAPRPAPAPPVSVPSRTIKMQTSFSANDEVYGAAADDFADELRKLSNGKFKVEVFPAGAIVKPFQVHDAAADGVLDAAFSVPVYIYGKNKAFALLDGAVPFGLGPVELVRWYQGEGQSIADKVYREIGLKMLPCGIQGPQGGGWYDRPLTDGDSLKRVKIRVVGLAADLFAAAGAQVIQLPGGEIVPALERGLINAAEFSVPKVDLAFGFQDLFKYYYFPGWHHPAEIHDFVVSLKYWDALNAAERSIFEQACRNNVQRALARIPELEREGLDGLRRHGVTVREFPRAVLDHARRASVGVIQKLTSECADCRRVYESMSRFR